MSDLLIDGWKKSLGLGLLSIHSKTNSHIPLALETWGQSETGYKNFFFVVCIDGTARINLLESQAHANSLHLVHLKLPL